MGPEHPHPNLKGERDSNRAPGGGRDPVPTALHLPGSSEGIIGQASPVGLELRGSLTSSAGGNFDEETNGEAGPMAPFSLIYEYLSSISV